MTHIDENGKTRGAGVEPTSIESYYAEIRRFFGRHAPHDADDLTQETFAACLAGMSTRRGPSLRAFLRGIANHKLNDWLRRKHRMIERGSAIDPDDLTICDPEPPAPVDPALMHALRRLSPRDQNVLELYYWKDWTTRAIAIRERTSEVVIRGRLHRARNRLSAMLPDRMRGEDRRS